MCRVGRPEPRTSMCVCRLADPFPKNQFLRDLRPLLGSIGCCTSRSGSHSSRECNGLLHLYTGGSVEEVLKLVRRGSVDVSRGPNEVGVQLSCGREKARAKPRCICRRPWKTKRAPKGASPPRARREHGPKRKDALTFESPWLGPQLLKLDALRADYGGSLVVILPVRLASYYCHTSS